MRVRASGKPRKVFVLKGLYTKYDLSPRHRRLDEWLAIPRSYEHEAI